MFKTHLLNACHIFKLPTSLNTSKSIHDVVNEFVKMIINNQTLLNGLTDRYNPRQTESTLLKSPYSYEDPGEANHRGT